MLNVLIVGAGGFLGTIMRYLMGLIPFQHEFPLITLIINFLGSFIIGGVYEFSLSEFSNSKLTLFMKTGVCGGFTTFSAFSLETFSLIENKKYFYASAYVFLSVFLCVLGTWLGILTAKKLKTLI